VTGGKPGEDLGIGWGVQVNPDLDAMGVNDVRHWQDDADASTEDAAVPDQPDDEARTTRDADDDPRGR
jgi:hypothetical protein